MLSISFDDNRDAQARTPGNTPAFVHYKLPIRLRQPAAQPLNFAPLVDETCHHCG
jgi:hypothetical protein